MSSSESILENIAISPKEELLAYEYLYAQRGASLKSVTAATVHAEKLPSEVLREQIGFLVPEELDVINEFLKKKSNSFAIAINGTPSYPAKLRVSERPTPLFYYRGDIGFLEARSISIVGARKASEEGLARARRLARELVEGGYAIVSGLAIGIDTAALTAAIERKGSVIGVIGTPIDEYYPKENKALQDRISSQFLLVSQVPLYRYANQPFKSKRVYFPERNELMAAISDATVIVEASDTSGTLTQARACLAHKRPLFILRSCVEDSRITWPTKFLDKDPQHVFAVESTQEIVEILDTRN